MIDAEKPSDMGLQPLDAILEERGLTNRDLVGSSTEQLTHKQVQKARRGRRVSTNIQNKILKALNTKTELTHTLDQLFNYR